MPITFSCSGCQTRLSIGRRKAGQPITCPKCLTALVVPNTDPADASGITSQPASKADLVVSVPPRPALADPHMPPLAATPTLPARYLAASVAAVLLLCALGYVAARQL